MKWGMLGVAAHNGPLARVYGRMEGMKGGLSHKQQPTSGRLLSYVLRPYVRCGNVCIQQQYPNHSAYW